VCILRKVSRYGGADPTRELRLSFTIIFPTECHGPQPHSGEFAKMKADNNKSANLENKAQGSNVECTKECVVQRR